MAWCLIKCRDNFIGAVMWYAVSNATWSIIKRERTCRSIITSPVKEEHLYGPHKIHLGLSNHNTIFPLLKWTEQSVVCSFSGVVGSKGSQELLCCLQSKACVVDIIVQSSWYYFSHSKHNIRVANRSLFYKQQTSYRIPTLNHTSGVNHTYLISVAFKQNIYIWYIKGSS
jgi:hypothetical protein